LTEICDSLSEAEQGAFSLLFGHPESPMMVAIESKVLRYCPSIVFLVPGFAEIPVPSTRACDPEKGRAKWKIAILCDLFVMRQPHCPSALI
jgi:hypothetical protein